jgi:hypothetical protein
MHLLHDRDLVGARLETDVYPPSEPLEIDDD